MEGIVVKTKSKEDELKKLKSDFVALYRKLTSKQKTKTKELSAQKKLAKSGETVHSYYKPKSRISVLDTSIGICHFHKTEKFYGHEGGFFKICGAPMPPEDWKYLVSYNRTKL